MLCKLSIYNFLIITLTYSVGITYDVVIRKLIINLLIYFTGLYNIEVGNHLGVGIVCYSINY